MSQDNSVSLLVPVALQALVVNENDLRATTWSLAHKNFAGLKNFEALEPPPFARGSDWPRRGVTLHWALPDGLARGQTRTGADGRRTLHFPPLPNRWLVLRRALDGPLATRAWIVESDYEGSDGSSLYPTADGRGVTRIGRALPLADWTGAPPAQTAALTAIGFGDVTFTAYIANLDNVFSFYDSLLDGAEPTEDEPRLRPLQLSYTVIGWYATPGDDPLAGWENATEWRQRMAQLKWSVGDENDLAQALHDAGVAGNVDVSEQMPARTLYHGVVAGVNWTGLFDGPAQTGPLGRRIRHANRQPETRAEPPPPARRPHLAIGNTLNDALAVLLDYLRNKEQPSPELATLLQALQADILAAYDEPGGQSKLKHEIHRGGFASRTGGRQWEVVPPPGDSSHPDSSQAPRLTPAEGRRLAELNELERLLDNLEGQLDAARVELYARWWKKQRRDHLPPAITADLPTSAELQRHLNEMLLQTRATQGEIDHPVHGMRRNVADQHEAAAATLTLKPASAQPYYEPLDPVLVIYGLQRSANHGEDGRFATDGSNTLFVRFSGQTIRAYRPTATTLVDRSTLVNEQDGWWPALAESVANKPIPGVALDLILEAQLLDPAQANWLARQTGQTAAAVQTDQRLIWEDYTAAGTTIAAMTQAAGWRGVRPSPIAVEPWQPPWSPLFFSWQVTWYPSTDKPAETMDQWVFNGLDYDWIGREPVGEQQAVTLQGRTLLAPVSTRSLEKSLTYLFEELHGENMGAAAKANLAQLQQTLRAADLLAQPLTGFHEQLIQRDRRQYHEPEDETIREALGDVVRAAPLPWPNIAGGSDFYPLRAGHFRLQRLWVVDAFGQVFDPIQERQLGRASFTPLRGRGLAPPGAPQRSDTQMLQLPPRIIQASRLNFQYRATESARGDNPIFAWLLPNHIDNAIVVYDGDGTTLGALLLVGTAANSRLRWQPANPEQPVVEFNEQPAQTLEQLAPTIANQELRRFVGSILQQGGNNLAFSDFMAAIDATLWSTDLQGQRQDNLSLLIGRPLALVGASLELQLRQPLVTDQIWSETGNGETRRFEENRIALKIGEATLRDDGVMGYFRPQADKRTIDYETFWAVQPLLDLEQPAPNYVQHGYLSLGLRQRQNVTLLLDPRGRIHLSSGILPTQVQELAARHVTGALRHLDVTFRIGPILNETRHLRMPLPADIRGGWSWIAHTGVDLDGKVQPSEAPITPATTQPILSDAPTYLRDGWLKLSDALGDGATPEENGATP